MTMSDHPRLVSIHAALDLVAENRPSLGGEQVALDDCLGRTVAVDVIADTTVPPLDASAMDGYAVRLVDVREPGAKLSVLGEVAAGAPNAFSIEAGEAVRIFTGSPMPVGADHVLVQEHAHIDGKTVVVTTAQEIARHIRKAGGDFRQGDKIIDAGTRLSARHIGLAASANHGTAIGKAPTNRCDPNCRQRIAPAGKYSFGWANRGVQLIHTLQTARISRCRGCTNQYRTG